MRLEIHRDGAVQVIEENVLSFQRISTHRGENYLIIKLPPAPGSLAEVSAALAQQYSEISQDESVKPDVVIEGGSNES